MKLRYGLVAPTALILFMFVVVVFLFAGLNARSEAQTTVLVSPPSEWKNKKVDLPTNTRVSVKLGRATIFHPFDVSEKLQWGADFVQQPSAARNRGIFYGYRLDELTQADANEIVEEMKKTSGGLAAIVGIPKGQEGRLVGVGRPAKWNKMLATTLVASPEMFQTKRTDAEKLVYDMTWRKWSSEQGLVVYRDGSASEQLKSTVAAWISGTVRPDGLEYFVAVDRPIKKIDKSKYVVLVSSVQAWPTGD